MSANQRADRVMTQLDPNYVASRGAAEPVTITSKSGGVAVFTINNPPVNSYSPAVAAAFERCYNEALRDNSIKAIVITGAGRFFMAGADIAHLQKTQNAAEVDNKFLTNGHKLFNAMESGPKPCVAAVNGDAFGGGLELAMICNARIGTKKKQIRTS
jgi:enoyl-CoA hydratase/carnithine racemase